MAWARLDGITAEDLPIGLPPVDRYSFERIRPHPDQWVRVLRWSWRLRGVLTPTELAAWADWRKEWWPYGHAPAVGSLAMKTSRVTIDAGPAARLEALARMVHRPTAEIVRTLSYAMFDDFLRLHARRSVTEQRGRPEAFGQ